MAKRIVDEEMRFSIVINGDPAQKELHEVQKATKDLMSETSKLRTEKRRLERQNKTETARYKEVTAELKRKTTTIQDNNARMNQLEKQIGVTGLTMQQLSARARALRLAISQSIPNDPGTKKLQAELQEVQLQMRKVRMESTGMRSSIGKVADGFNRFAALGATVIASLTGVVFSIQKFIDFNSELSDAQANVQKTTGLTKKQVDELTQSFGALKTRSSRMELLKLAEEAGRLGIEGVENIKAFTEIANEMNVALGDDLSTEQIREVGKATKIFKVGEKNGLGFAEAMQSLGSAINHVSASGANQASFLVDFLKRTAGVSASANIAAEDMIGLAASFDELGQTTEVSGTVMNQLLINMAKDTQKFADTAGISLQEFSNLLNKDANEALVLFLKGLEEGNPMLRDMAQSLDGLGIDGARGVQTILALANNTELLTQRQKQAGEALRENTSLTNEYNLKNENFAAIIQQIKKAFNGFLVGVKAPLETLIRGFADLFGIVDDANEAFAKQNEQTFKAARNSRILASESQTLLNRYEELTKDGIIPTTEQKAELEKISLKLRDRLGESVFMINEETGAFEINSNAVREQIKLKRLQADEEASTLASRSKGLEDAIKQRQKDAEIARKELELRKQIFKEEEGSNTTRKLNQASRSTRPGAVFAAEESVKRTPAYKRMQQAEKALNEINNDIEEKLENQQDLLKQLADLNYTQEDIDNFFNPPEVTKDQPKEGETKTVGLTNLVYKNGKWVVVPPKVDDTTGGSSIADRYTTAINDSIDAQLQAMQDGVDKELAIEDERHRRVLEKLKARLAEEKNLTQEEREAIQKNIEAQETIHQRNRANIIDGGIDDYIDSQMAQYDRESAIRQEAHLKELNALGENQQAKEQKIKAFKRQEKELEKQHLTEVEQLLRDMLNAMDFQGFDINILSDAQVQDLKDKLVEIGIAAAEVDQIIKSLQGKGEDSESDFLIGQADILGFTPDQWIATFENLDKTAGKLQALGMAVQAAANLYSMFSQAQLQQEQRAFEEFMQNNEAKKDALDRRLNNGLINERQHREQLKNLEKEEEKRRAKLRYKQAKAEKEQLLAQTISQVAFNVASVIANPVLAAIVGALGALQIAQVARQPLPAKGYEKGFYGGKFPVEREQDGKVFNAGFGGMSRSGIVDNPTVFLAGEQGKSAPEMIISGKDYANFAPDFKQSLSREIARVKGFEDGYIPSSANNTIDAQLYAEMTAMLKVNKAFLQILVEEGISANVIANEYNARELDEALEKFRKRKQSAQL